MISTKYNLTRRAVIKSSVLGTLSVAVPNILSANGNTIHSHVNEEDYNLPDRYPAIKEDIVSEVVGASHFDLERVKKIVEGRPELARATWDWGFGDWESAIGAASHVGRRDIVDYLIGQGARPNLFTYAMWGDYNSVRAMIEFDPKVRFVRGPHGITLLEHVRIGLLSKSISPEQRENGEKLMSYLEEIGGADNATIHIKISEQEKQRYLGDYYYGHGEKDGFSVKLNMRQLLTLGKLGSFGGALYQISPGVFTYNGAPSVRITFEQKGGEVVAFRIQEPDHSIRAVKK